MEKSSSAMCLLSRWLSLASVFASQVRAEPCTATLLHFSISVSLGFLRLKVSLNPINPKPLNLSKIEAETGTYHPSGSVL